MAAPAPQRDVGDVNVLAQGAGRDPVLLRVTRFGGQLALAGGFVG